MTNSQEERQVKALESLARNLRGCHLALAGLHMVASAGLSAWLTQNVAPKGAPGIMATLIDAMRKYAEDSKEPE